MPQLPKLLRLCSSIRLMMWCKVAYEVFLRDMTALEKGLEVREGCPSVVRIQRGLMSFSSTSQSIQSSHSVESPLNVPSVVRFDDKGSRSQE